MSDETETGTQTLDSSSDAITLKIGREAEMDTQGIEASADDLTLRSVDERIKQATDPSLRRVEELCVLLAGRTEMESVGISEASGSRLNNESFSPSINRHDTCQLFNRHSPIFRNLSENLPNFFLALESW